MLHFRLSEPAQLGAVYTSIGFPSVTDQGGIDEKVPGNSSHWIDLPIEFPDTAFFCIGSKKDPFPGAANGNACGASEVTTTQIHTYSDDGGAAQWLAFGH